MIFRFRKDAETPPFPLVKNTGAHMQTAAERLPLASAYLPARSKYELGAASIVQCPIRSRKLRHCFAYTSLKRFSLLPSEITVPEGSGLFMFAIRRVPFSV